MLGYYTNLKEKIEVVFAGKPAPENLIQDYKKDLSSFDSFTITEQNYNAIYKVIDDQMNHVKAVETELTDKKRMLKKAADYYEFASKVAGGTYIQSLTLDEHIRKHADYIPHGITVS